ncbi:MAG TPA: ABC transporter permease [Vicinamibacterales bacterium]|nr:ABC transporter permease [Vicinamibacterales bacterium]
MSRADRDLDAEVAAHLAEAAEEHMARGLSPQEARDAALRDFGGVTQVKQVHREMRSYTLINWLDIKLGGRMLVKYPGLTIVGGLAMAFAICVGLVVFRVLSLFLHPTLPLPQGDRLVEIQVIDLEVSDEEQQILHDFLQWRQSLRSVTDLGAWRNSNPNLLDAFGDSRPVAVAEMSAAGFKVSDGVPLMGRVLVEADEQPAAPPVAVIGYDIWRTRFGGDPNIIGRIAKFGNEDVSIVGVMREGYEFPVAHDVWMPLKTALLDQTPRSGPPLVAFGLLAPGESMKTAQAELTTVGRQVAAQSPATHQRLEPRLRPFAMMMSPAGDPAGGLILYSVYVFTAALVILICGNVGLLLFARAASREADLVVRTALGASRGRIVAQMFTEAFVLGGLAAIVGIIAADIALRNWGMSFLEVNMGRLPFWFDLSLSPATFAVASLLTIIAAAMAGILPALKITRGMGHRLKQTTAGSGGLQFGGVWTVVIVAQVAATVIFPAIVYLMQTMVSGIEDFHAGFPTEQYLAVQIERDYAVFAGNEDAGALERNARLAGTLDELRRQIASRPGVAGVTFAATVPTTGGPQKLVEMAYDLDASGAAAVNTNDGEGPLREATVAAVDPSYFDVLKAPVIAGRGFTAADAVTTSRVAIVDQSFVEQVLEGRNAAGQQVRFRYPGKAPRPWSGGNASDPPGLGDWYEIVGVVPELGLGAPTRKGRAAGLYLPAAPNLFVQIQMMVHVPGGDPMTIAPQVREAVTAIDPSLRLVNVQRVNEVNNDVLWVSRLWVRITAVLSSLALLLSLAGIYAVLAFTVARRTREIGVRVALGASRPRVVAATFRRPLLQVTGGVLIGTIVVFTAAILIRNTEMAGFENDLTLAGMAQIVGYGMSMLGVCMLACLIPTRRALNVEPTTALRTE